MDVITKGTLTIGGLVAGALAILILSGCAAGTQTTVAQTEVALTAAEKAATLYAGLPQCAATNKPVCSDAATIAQIKAADNAAYNATMAARSGGSSAQIATAAAAVAALVTLIPTAATTH